MRLARDVPVNLIYSPDPLRGWSSREFCTFHVPSSKSKSCDPSRFAAGRAGCAIRGDAVW